MQLAFSDRENVDHSPTSFSRIPCSFLTQAAKVRSGPPLSDGLSACWAIPRHTGLTLRLGTLCARAGQTESSRTSAAMDAIGTARIGSSPAFCQVAGRNLSDEAPNTTLNAASLAATAAAARRCGEARHCWTRPHTITGQ